MQVALVSVAFCPQKSPIDSEYTTHWFYTSNITTDKKSDIILIFFVGNPSGFFISLVVYRTFFISLVFWGFTTMCEVCCTSNCSSTIHREDYPFSTELALLHCQRSVRMCIRVRFCSLLHIPRCAYSLANNMLPVCPARKVYQDIRSLTSTVLH